MKTKVFSHIDFLLLFCVTVLVSIGITFIYSAAINSDGVLVAKVRTEYIKQIIWAGISLVFLLVASYFDFRKIYRYAFILYIIICVVLLYTRLFGYVVNNSKSWIRIGPLSFQPSEFAKLIYILFFARFLDTSKLYSPIKRFLLSLLILLVPMGLILIQPDFGSSIVFLPIFFIMGYLGGLSKKYLSILLIVGIITSVYTVLPVYETQILNKTVPFIHVLTNKKVLFILIVSFLLVSTLGVIGKLLFKKKYFYWIALVFGILAVSLFGSYCARKVMKEYQIKRLIIFIDPSSDPLGSGWNIRQSKIAIGSGTFKGRGYMKGSQSHKRFLPEQSTDFIFSIYAEETGFVGGIILFILFFAIFSRMIFAMRVTKNVYGYYIIGGIFAMMFFHFLINIGMVMGIMPCTGIPLPFLSYGGSSLLTNMIAIGLVMSVYTRRLEF